MNEVLFWIIAPALVISGAAYDARRRQRHWSNRN